MGIALLGVPLGSNIAFSSSKTTLNHSGFTSLINSKLQTEGYEVIFNESFSLNSQCKAFPLLKKNLLRGDEEGLLLVMDNGDHFLLSNKHLETYSVFISNFKFSLKSHGLEKLKDINTVRSTTPFKILKSNQTKDFRFQTIDGNIVEVHSFKKKNYVKVL
ncbi:hypothetical protein [Postechiella marina]